ncbi:MAG: hypothetical protein ACLT98_13115 [Eggerthellaceae bacterium]
MALAKAALLFATLCAALLFAAPAYAEEASSDDKIHIMTFEGSDAIIRSNGSSAWWIPARTTTTQTEAIPAIL